MIYIKKDALKAVSRFSASKDIRYCLNGVNIESTPDCTRLVATDGHAMGIHKYEVKNSETGTVIIPADVVKTILSWKTPKYSTDEITLTIGKECKVEYHGNSITFAGLDGTFPNYRRVIPAELSGVASQFDPDLINRCATAAKDLGHKPLITIGHNGPSAAIVFIGSYDLCAILMPLRAEEFDISGFSWVATLPEAEKIAA